VTYSIVAVDKETGVYGVAVASKALCVGAHVPWGHGGHGALATQAWHDLRYGWEGLALLEQERSAADVVQSVTHGDEEAPHRQLGVVDRAGRVASYTGSRCLPWAGGMCGPRYAVQGNLLAGPHVVEAMSESFERSDGLPFAQRLVDALLAGDDTGGDRRGRQSAALKLWSADVDERTPFGVVADLRVDDAERPVERLRRLLPRLWLEYGAPDPRDLIELSAPTLARVAGVLGTDAGVAEEALALWASERNLERRVVEGHVDRTVLDSLESGPETVLARATAEPPRTGWPT
jgi:uncharacterized Ntn-hydrolase superfamily protein